MLRDANHNEPKRRKKNSNNRHAVVVAATANYREAKGNADRLLAPHLSFASNLVASSLFGVVLFVAALKSSSIFASPVFVNEKYYYLSSR